MSPLPAAITSDIDSLESIYKGQGCRNARGYTHTEIRMGLETFARFLEPYHAKATLFMVGNDFKYPENQNVIKGMVKEGHEIANHTMTHAQGFRLLSLEQKEAELAGMEAWCEKVTGKRPVGFRSPGWNISDDALPILLRHGYLYDSSVFPTSLMPVLKLSHWYTMRSRSGGDRSTMGQSDYMFAPIAPYRTSSSRLGRRGAGGLMEFPIAVTPILRLPFFATFLVATGIDQFRRSYRSLKDARTSFQFQMHLSDFVDYNHPDLVDQVPLDGQGQYVPQALRMSLEQKLPLFRAVMDAMAEDYEFVTLKAWSQRFIKGEKN